ncbi:MAG: hypothetical protein DMG61_03620 [Acidobacteria bacterium]|nr:MAG: hypothetical protein DMG61_03620 [Acidobacteriota bacterium]
MKQSSLLLILAFACIAARGASADTITFNFSSTPGNTTTATYTSDGVTISAASGTSADLFFKNGGGDETGLGLTPSSENEINGGQSIVFDLSSLFSKNITSLSLALGSIQTGESGQACDAFGTCVAFGSSQSGQLVDITSLFSEMQSKNSGTLTITAPNGNVLIDDLEATTAVPEPSSLLLLGTGVFAMAGLGRRMGRKLLAR